MRYAVYFAPLPGTELARLAASWLGRDAFGGEPVGRIVPEGFSAETMAGLTEDAGRYGFHATIVAPFTPAAGFSEADLVAALDAFTAGRKKFAIGEIVIGQLGPFFALVPASSPDALALLESDCVEHFRPFMAPLSPADIERRKPHSLTPRQRLNLERWGYPYVKDEFRFHMTLTNPVPDTSAAQVRTAIARHFLPVTGRPLPVDSLCLFAEPERGAPFRCIHTSLMGQA